MVSRFHFSYTLNVWGNDPIWRACETMYESLSGNWSDQWFFAGGPAMLLMEEIRPPVEVGSWHPIILYAVCFFSYPKCFFLGVIFCPSTVAVLFFVWWTKVKNYKKLPCTWIIRFTMNPFSRGWEQKFGRSRCIVAKWWNQWLFLVPLKGGR